MLEALGIALKAGQTTPWIYDIEKKTYQILDSSNLSVRRVINDIPCIEKDYKAEDIDAYYEFLETVIAGTSQSSEYIMKVISTIGKNVKYVQFSVKCVYDENGIAENIIGACKDLSSVIEMEEQLRLRMEILNSIYDRMTMGIVIFDKNGYLMELNDKIGRAHV